MTTHFENTANRLRPKSFDELTGQSFVVTTICNSIEKNHIAPAYLFSGPRGVGKTSAARLVALAINRPENTPITELEYAGSDDIRHSRSLDVIEIDGASYTSVENVRNIREELQYAPVHFRYKVYIIDEVHMLSNSAFNALLKTIEEPPEYAVFIFATTDPHKIPATIRSRCQQFSFRLISQKVIIDQLVALCNHTKMEYEMSALQWIAKESQGSLRDAYMLFDQIQAFSGNSISLETIKTNLGFSGIDSLNILFTLCLSQNREQVLMQLHDTLAQGGSIEQLILDTAEYIRNILLLKSNIVAEEIIGFSSEMFDKTIYNTYTSSQLEYALSLALSCYRNLRYTANARFELELLFSQLCDLQYYISPTQLVKNLHELQGSLVTTPTAPNTTTATTPATMASDSELSDPTLKKPSISQLVSRVKSQTHDKDMPAPAVSPEHSNSTHVLWSQVVARVRAQNESFALILDSAEVEQEDNTLHVTFDNEYGYKKYMSFEKKMEVLVKKITNQDIEIRVVLAHGGDSSALDIPPTLDSATSVSTQHAQNTIINNKEGSTTSDTQDSVTSSQGAGTTPISDNAAMVLDVFKGAQVTK